eukprot:3072-Heterococcus_DN1.PRE.1
MAQIRRLHEIPSIATGGDRQDLPSFSRSSSRASNASSAQSGGKPTNRAVAVQAASDERRESLNSTQSNGGQKARRGSNGSSSGHSSIGSGSDPHAQTWTAIQTARSELDKGAKAKKKRCSLLAQRLFKPQCTLSLAHDMHAMFYCDCTVQLDAMRRRSSVAATVDPETGASHLSLTAAATAPRLPSISCSTTAAAVASGTTATGQSRDDAAVAVSGSSAVAGSGTRRRSSGGNGIALSSSGADGTTTAVTADAGARQRGIEYGNKALKSVTLENQLKEFKKTILEQIIDTLRCERATLMFIDHHNSEMSAFAAIAVCQSVVRWHGVNYTSALQLIVVDRPPCITCKHSDCRTFTA